MLRMPGRKSREYARYSPPLLFLSFVLYTRLLQSDVGAQEQEYPGGTYYDVEIPNDQAGGLASSICVICASLLKAKLG